MWRKLFQYFPAIHLALPVRTLYKATHCLNYYCLLSSNHDYLVPNRRPRYRVKVVLGDHIWSVHGRTNEIVASVDKIILHPGFDKALCVGALVRIRILMTWDNPLINIAWQYL